jgi:hypothetical protein
VVRDGNASFAVKLTDVDLHHLAPGGEIRYQGLEGFRELELMQNEAARSLLIRISEAIEDHLVTVSVN